MHTKLDNKEVLTFMTGATKEKKYGAHSHVHLLFSNFLTIIHSRGQRYVVPLSNITGTK